MSATPATTQAHVGERQAIPLSLFGMILFISSEVMFFGGFFGAYFDLRSGYKIWPPPVPHIEQIELWPVPLILTIVLVTSSFTMQAGLSAIKQGDNRGLRRWLKVTILLGAIFLLLQLYDYSRLGFGIKDGVYATMFYTMTGFHFAHVFGGALFLYVILLQSYQGEFSAQDHTGVEAATLYWHFVDIVWICLFSTFYLLR
ncbi:MAG TPA: heme-copper oxidase subunit III [Actinomycetota bacterium]|nr:heme-copper oxidase subunit III [Actinomycetota bacterium]